MKQILVVSDIHGALEKFELLQAVERGADALIICGDLTHFGGAAHARGVIDAARRFNLPLTAVHGNCDRQGVGVFLDQEELFIHDRWAELLGIPILGWGGSLPAPIPTPSTYSEEEAAAELDKHSTSRPDVPWIFVTHQPPFESEADRIRSGAHVGSRSVAEFISTSRPALILCGHIHEAYSVSNFSDSLLVNPGSLKDGRYGIIRWNEGRSEAELREL